MSRAGGAVCLPWIQVSAGIDTAASSPQLGQWFKKLLCVFGQIAMRSCDPEHLKEHKVPVFRQMNLSCATKVC